MQNFVYNVILYRKQVSRRDFSVLYLAKLKNGKKIRAWLWLGLIRRSPKHAIALKAFKKAK